MYVANIGIIGHGFVGKAVDYGFGTQNTVVHVADTKYDITVSDIFSRAPLDLVFVCVPTPMETDGSINANAVLDVLSQIQKYGNGCTVVIKSTVTPNKLAECFEIYDNLVYSPEFLRESTANDDFVHPNMHVIGTYRERSASKVIEMYKYHSKCAACPYITTKPEVASMVKYTINCFLATKVTFFNELFDLFTQMGIEDEYGTFVSTLCQDPRMGTSHMQVPGPDGRRGFGGACFGKDTSAFSHFAESSGVDLQLLNQSIRVNSGYRSAYQDLHRREQEQNVTYQPSQLELL